MQKKVFTIVVLALAFFAVIYLRNQSRGLEINPPSAVPPSPTISIGKHVFSIELAQTSDTRQLGLGNRKNIDDHAGMLFVFPQSDRHSIWMKDMLFPLDIIWLTPSKTREGALTVVDIRTGVLPETYPEAFLPKGDALYVLELSAGSAERAGIGLGSVLTLRK